MPECPPSGVPEDLAGEYPHPLTPGAVEAVLADFRTWLERAAAAGELSPMNGQPPEERLDLHTLLSQFTALRHEVNLQTRAVRAQQELNAETLRQYGEALQDLHAAQTAVRETEQQSLDELLRPLLKNLVDAYDALALARREVERVQDALLPALAQLDVPLPFPPGMPEEPLIDPDPIPPGPAAPGLLGRLFGRRQALVTSRSAKQWEDLAGQYRTWAEGLQDELASLLQLLTSQQEQVREAARAGERVRLLFDSVLTGYRMSLQRLERTLQECELEPIACVGAPFDPELMEVVAVTADSDRPANEVVEEVRRGYLWRGRVFRYAQVRVAR